MATQGARKDSPMFVASANALAGAAGGIIAMTIVFPLDTIRTQLQAKANVLSPIIKVGDKRSSQLIMSPNPNISEEEIDDKQEENDEFLIKKQQIGIKQVIHKIYRKEGIGGFYRALSTQLICIFISDMVYFFAVTLIKQILYGKREVDAISNLKASTIAGIVNVFITSPFWRAQVQLMLQSKKLKKLEDDEDDNKYITKGNNNEDEEESKEDIMNGLFDAWNKIINKEGLNGLFKGIGPSLWLVSNPIIQFVCYEETVNILKRWNNTDQLSALKYFICGAIGKALATFATYPLQVMQTQLRKHDTPFKNMKDCINKFAIPKIKNGDIAPLFSGFTAKLYQTVSNSAIKFMIYEKVLELVKILLRSIQKTLIAMIFVMFVSKTNASTATMTANV